MRPLPREGRHGGPALQDLEGEGGSDRPRAWPSGLCPAGRFQRSGRRKAKQPGGRVDPGQSPEGPPGRGRCRRVHGGRMPIPPTAPGAGPPLGPVTQGDDEARRGSAPRGRTGNRHGPPSDALGIDARLDAALRRDKALTGRHTAGGAQLRQASNERARALWQPLPPPIPILPCRRTVRSPPRSAPYLPTPTPTHLLTPTLIHSP